MVKLAESLGAAPQLGKRKPGVWKQKLHIRPAQGSGRRNPRLCQRDPRDSPKRSLLADGTWWKWVFAFRVSLSFSLIHPKDPGDLVIGWTALKNVQDGKIQDERESRGREKGS